jgi:choline kinase
MKLAVFLLAGGGIRLKPYTNMIPKCLVEINNKPLLIRMLDYLSYSKIDKVIMVIGYKGHKIIEAVGRQWKNIDIEYINNSEWETTNNVVSLNLALPMIKEDFILLEGDLIFTWEAFKPLFEPDRIAVSNYQNHMNGTLVSIDRNKFVTNFIMNDNLSENEKLDLYKTVNLYSFSYKNFNDLIIPNLHKLINSDQKQVYYEQAIADAVSNFGYKTTAVNFHNSLWYEIDTEEDLLKAQEIFKDTEV